MRNIKKMIAKYLIGFLTGVFFQQLFLVYLASSQSQGNYQAVMPKFEKLIGNHLLAILLQMFLCGLAGVLVVFILNKDEEKLFPNFMQWFSYYATSGIFISVVMVILFKLLDWTGNGKVDISTIVATCLLMPVVIEAVRWLYLKRMILKMNAMLYLKRKGCQK